MWRTEVQLSRGELESARRGLDSLRFALDKLEKEAQAAWSIASNARNFYEERELGGYSRPSTVLVELFRSESEMLPKPHPVERDFRVMGSWTLTFKD
jgi:hypothetical protein